MICDVCSEPLTVIKKKTRRELVIIPAQTKIIEHATYFYSCKNCDKSRYLNIVSCKLLNRSNLVNCFCLGVMCVLELKLTNYSETF